MLKKSLIGAVILSTGLSTAIAAPSYTTYKGEQRYQTRGNYKGEVTTVKTHRVCDSIPCKTYTINPGPYIGLNPGLRTNYNQTSSVYKGFEGTFFAGYSFISSDFYLGTELFVQHSVQLQNYRHDLNNNLNPIGVRTTWGGGLAFMPGYIVSDTLLAYLRLGALETHFRDLAATTYGGQAGVGLEGSVSQSWDMRAEYVYTTYKSISGIGVVRSDQFMLGILYKFWS